MHKVGNKIERNNMHGERIKILGSRLHDLVKNTVMVDTCRPTNNWGTRRKQDIYFFSNRYRHKELTIIILEFMFGKNVLNM